MSYRFPESLTIVYDRQCSFCARIIQWLRRLDVFCVLTFHDGNDEALLRRLFPLVQAEDAAGAMLAVATSGEVFTGFYAFRRLIWVSPWLWSLVPIFYFPGSSFLGTRLYAWIAKNRQSFGCRAKSYES